MDPNLLNGTTLAYIGDGYYEHHIRMYLVRKGETKVNNLHRMATKFTSGEAQANIIRYFIEKDVLTDQELSIYKRGRNQSSPGRKNISQAIYHDSTGFEALIGFLSMKDESRAKEVIDLSIEYIEGML